MSDPVLVTFAGRVAELRFNRPDGLNALDVELAEGFAATSRISALRRTGSPPAAS